jgi:hypothetical protein
MTVCSYCKKNEASYYTLTPWWEYSEIIVTPIEEGVEYTSPYALICQECVDQNVHYTRRREAHQQELEQWQRKERSDIGEYSI